MLLVVHPNVFHLMFLLRLNVWLYPCKRRQPKELFSPFLNAFFEATACFSLLTLFAPSAIWRNYQHMQNITKLHYIQKQGVRHYINCL